VRIRDLQWKSISMWPPQWSISDHEAGEEGFLRDVQFRDDQTPSCISVVAAHFGDDRNGIIILEDQKHLATLYQKLTQNIGRPLKEIGDLKIDCFAPILKKGPKRVNPRIPQGSHSVVSLPAAFKSKSKD
jgi:hypothetical protein